MKKPLAIAITLGLALSSLCALGRTSQDPPATKPAAVSEDEKAIRASVADFVKAFEKADVKTIAASFTEGAEALDPEGAALRGRDALEQHYQTRFADAPGDKIEVTVELVHMLAPGLASIEGKTVLKPGDGEPDSPSRFSTVLAKIDGRWLIASVRELEDNSITPHEHLKELEWMIGEWVQESGESVILNSFAWSEDKNYIIRSFNIRVEGKPTLTGTQRIAWDPLTEQFKSWVFDSRGGHSEALWVRNGRQWIVKTRGVRPDGLVATSTQSLIQVNKDRIRWKSSDRTLGDNAADDIEEIVMVRKPPEPK